jgi:hypothetical protein
MEIRLRLHILPAPGGKSLDEITRNHVQAAVVAWSKTLTLAIVAIVYGYLASAPRAAPDVG